MNYYIFSESIFYHKNAIICNLQKSSLIFFRKIKKLRNTQIIPKEQFKYSEALYQSLTLLRPNYDFVFLRIHLSCNFSCEVFLLLLKTFTCLETNKLLNLYSASSSLGNFLKVLSNCLLSVLSLYIYLIY